MNSGRPATTHPLRNSWWLIYDPARGQARTAQHSPESEVRGVTGIGFGAANLALAVALHESGAGDRALFLEKQKEFGWHRGMLIEGSSLQVSFLKDIATMRNPTSDFRIPFLLAGEGPAGRLHQPAHPAALADRVPRLPQWAADRLGHMVEYGVEATGVRPVTDAGEVVALDVLAGDRVVTRTRNLVIASGLRPPAPRGRRDR